MSKWKCGSCGRIYTGDEYFNLDTVWVDPENTEYGKTIVCSECGYVFHKQKPQNKTFGYIKHHMTSLHWLANKLTLGRLAKPHHIDIWLSTVFLELGHNDWDGREPMWYESMFFPSRPGQREHVSPEIPDNYKEMSHEEQMKVLAPTYTEGCSPMDCWMQERYRTREQAIEGHQRWHRLLEQGKYLILYSLEKRKGKYRVTWRISFDEDYIRILHGARITGTEDGL